MSVLIELNLGSTHDQFEGSGLTGLVMNDKPRRRSRVVGDLATIVTVVEIITLLIPSLNPMGLSLASQNDNKPDEFESVKTDEFEFVMPDWHFPVKVSDVMVTGVRRGRNCQRDG
jgi:hypothetical protein